MLTISEPVWIFFQETSEEQKNTSLDTVDRGTAARRKAVTTFTLISAGKLSAFACTSLSRACAVSRSCASLDSSRFFFNWCLANCTWHLMLLLLRLNSLRQALQKSNPFNITTASFKYSLTCWAELTPFGSDNHEQWKWSWTFTLNSLACLEEMMVVKPNA